MTSSSSDGFKCSICLEFNSGSSFKDYFVSTPGGHVFHHSCIKKLIEAGHTCCPMCREHVNLNNLTRLYGIDPSPRPGKARNSNSNLALGKCDSLGAPRPDYVFKIVLLGDSSVGKSSLLKRFTTGEFKGDLVATTGCDLCFKMMEMGGKLIKLSIWDTVGQEKFRSVATNCVRNAHGVMLCYDVKDSNSFSSIERWLKFVDDYAPTDVVKLLVGNKLDVGEEERMVPQRLGKSLATKLSLSFFETSAKEENNVEAAFRCLLGEIMETTVLNPNSENYDINDNSSRMSRSRSGCRLQLPTSRSYEYDQMPSLGPPECIC